MNIEYTNSKTFKKLKYCLVQVNEFIYIYIYIYIYTIFDIIYKECELQHYGDLNNANTKV